MSDLTVRTIELEEAVERLRQRRETFNLLKDQRDKWFFLRLRMGYAAVIMLPAIALLCGFVILNSSDYSPSVITAAAGALFVDVLGLVGSVWKLVIDSDSFPASFSDPSNRHHK